MGMLFKKGEQPIRAGVYQRYFNEGSGTVSNYLNGICAVLFKASFGPLEPQIFTSAEDFRKNYGTTGTTDAVTYAFSGGATKVIAARLGSDGECGFINITDKESKTAGKLKLKYVGARALSCAYKTKLGSQDTKILIIYENGSELEKIELQVVGDNDVAALESGLNYSQFLAFEKENNYTGSGTVEAFAGKSFTGGRDPVITNNDYSVALVQLEAYAFNTICVDTEDNAVHLLLASYIDRIYNEGKLSFCVIGEKSTIDFSGRLAHAKSYNNPKVIYVGHCVTLSNDTLLEGYKAAALLAGRFASMKSTESATHQVIPGAVNITERLTNAQYEDAINNGMIVFSESTNGICVDAGITTLVSPTGEDDEGWKKIKRLKVRFELMERLNNRVESVLAHIPNNDDGRANIIQIGNDEIQKMIAEGKLGSESMMEIDAENIPSGDTSWFKIHAYDLDNMEKIMLAYGFKYEGN